MRGMWKRVPELQVQSGPINIDDDNVKDWVDEWETMSKEKIEQPDEDVKPVQWVLVKVSRSTLSS